VQTSNSEGVDNINSSNGGNSASYLVAKLKRDAPGIAERLAAGEFRSAQRRGNLKSRMVLLQKPDNPDC
jgi:hypothetical protein